MENGPALSVSHKIHAENYAGGFLVDSQFLAGVAESQMNPTSYTAFVLDQETGYLAEALDFPTLAQALAHLNQMPRNWTFESTRPCGDASCHGDRCAEGKCKKQSCKIYVAPTEPSLPELRS